MEFIRINDFKLKVMLNKSDLDEFDIKTDELDYSNTETKRMFWDIIGRAKKAVGFCCDGMKVLVQLYSSRDGGCEMFVSKLEKAVRSSDDDDEQSLCYKPLYKKTVSESRTGAFSFESLEWLISVCRRLFGIGYSEKSSAFAGDDGKFYLFLDGLDATGYFPLDEYSFINEYGIPENAEAIQSFLYEHGRIIRKDDAVKILSVL